MSEKVSIKISAHLAAFIRPDAPLEGKLSVISGEVAATPTDRVTLLFFLCYDKDPEIKGAALAVMKRLPLDLVTAISISPDTHPRLNDLLGKLYPPMVAPLITPEAEKPDESELSDEELEEADVESPVEEEEEAEDEPATEEFKSKYQLAQIMGVGEKIKMALTGDKEWRSLLIKDSNKLVNGAVVKNPRITEPEVLTISKSVIQNEEILRIICHNKEWVKNYEIRKALVWNHKTPLPVALRFMSFLIEKDLATMGKSKNISSVLANQARRMLSAKKKS